MEVSQHTHRDPENDAPKWSSATIYVVIQACVAVTKCL